MVHYMCTHHRDIIVMTTQPSFLFYPSGLRDTPVFSTPTHQIMGHARPWHQGQVDFATLDMTAVHSQNKRMHLRLSHFLSAEFSPPPLVNSILPSSYQLSSLDWHLIRALKDHRLRADKQILPVQRVSSTFQKWSFNWSRSSHLLSAP